MHSTDGEQQQQEEEEQRPHKYIIQAQVLRNSWPLSESNWAFVQMLREIEKNELKGATLHTSWPNFYLTLSRILSIYCGQTMLII